VTHERSDMPPGGPAPLQSAGANPDMRDEHNAIFFAAVRATRMPMIVTDPHAPDHPIVFANPAFLNMTGYAPEELIGRNCRLMQGPDTDRDTVAEVRRAIAERRETAVEILNYKKSGASFWNALFVSPVFDRDGKLIYYFGSQLDVSRRRDAEDALRQAQKMEAIGQLSGGIAHDFNNLLTVIQGFSDILKNRLEQPERFDFAKARRQVEAISQAAERGSSLTQQMLAFARKQRLDGRIINVNEMIEQLMPVIERTLPDQVKVERRFSDHACNARIDATQAELAIMNVVINARDAMPGGGTIAIETATVAVRDGSVTLAQLPPGHYAQLTISDTGTGMSPDVLSRVTEPFFTTKEQGKGTGLGLSMVYGFARQSGGALLVESDEGAGTKVRLLFPCEDGPIEPEGSRPSRRGDRARGAETILLVEDQPDVAAYAQDVLEEFGYHILRAANGMEALDILNGDDEIDMLFTDLVMPGRLNGVQLARQARRRRPHLKVLLTTGYAETALERIDVRADEFDILNKPYRRSDLATKIRIVMDGPTGVG